MKNGMRRAMSLLLIFVMMFSSLSYADVTTGEQNLEFDPAGLTIDRDYTATSKLSGDLEALDVDENEDVRVIVELYNTPMLEEASSQGVKFTELNQSTVDVMESTIASEQTIAMDAISEVAEPVVHQQFDTVFNGFSMTVKAGDLQAIAELDNVKKVYTSNEYFMPVNVNNVDLAPVTVLNKNADGTVTTSVYQPDMNNSSRLTNSAYANEELGYSGEGLIVAIIDSGIDSTHKDLQLDTLVTDAALSQKLVNMEIVAQDLPGQYFTDKVPYGYNYMDKDWEIRDLGPKASEHGMHVAGTVAANGEIKGVAPDAQLLAMKVFGNDQEFPSTFGDVIIAAIDDSIKLGADVMNLSLGSTAAFVDEEDPEHRAITRATNAGIIMSISAGNSAFFGNGQSNPYATNPDIGVVGSPGLTAESIQVASVDNYAIKNQNMVSGEEIKTIRTLSPDKWNGTFELVAIGGDKLGGPENYEGIDVTGKVVLVSRGTHYFSDKVKWAKEAGAIGVLLYTDHRDVLDYLGGYEIPLSMFEKADGLYLEGLLETRESLSITITAEDYVDPNTGQISSFSSWGTTPALGFKPDVAAPGGNIWSTANNNGYQYMSGTSMAAPHVAGGSALVVERIEEDTIFSRLELEKQAKADFAKVLLMNTAVPVKGQFGYTSVINQGAGSMDLKAALTTSATLTNVKTGLASVNGGELRNNKLKFTLKLKNYGNDTLAYDVSTFVQMQDEYKGLNFLSTDALNGVVQSVTIAGEPVNGPVIIAPRKAVNVTFEMDFTNAFNWAGKAVLEAFPNGGFVESFVFFSPSDALVADAKANYDAAVKAKEDNVILILEQTELYDQLVLDIIAQDELIAAKDIEIGEKANEISEKATEIQLFEVENSGTVAEAMEAEIKLQIAKDNYEEALAKFAPLKDEFLRNSSTYAIAEVFQGDVRTLDNLFHILSEIEDMPYANKEVVMAVREELYAQIDEIISVLNTFTAAVESFAAVEDFLTLSVEERAAIFETLVPTIEALQEDVQAIDALLAQMDFEGYETYLLEVKATLQLNIATAQDAIVALDPEADDYESAKAALEAEIQGLQTLIEKIDFEIFTMNTMKWLKVDIDQAIMINDMVLDNIQSMKDHAVIVDNAAASLELAQTTFDAIDMTDYEAYKAELKVLTDAKEVLEAEKATLVTEKETLEADKAKMVADQEAATLAKETAMGETATLEAAVQPLKEALGDADLARSKAIELSLPALGFIGDWEEAPAFDAPRHDATSFYGLTGYINVINDGLYYMNEVSAFSPNGDGVMDEIIPYVSILRNVLDVNVQIVMEDGTVVKTLAKRDSMRKHYYDADPRNPKATLFNDGTFDGTFMGEDLPEGNYFLRYSGKLDTDAANNLKVRDIPFMLDRTKPVLGQPGYSFTDKLFTGHATDNLSGVSEYFLLMPEFDENDVLVGIKTLDSNETGEFDLTTLDLEELGLEELPVFVTYGAADYAGNEAIYPSLVQLVEGNVPVVTLSVQPFAVTTERSFTMTGVVSDELPLTSVKVDGETVELTATDNPGEFTFSKEMSFDKDGKTGIFVEAIDLAGNRTAFTRWFYIDSEAATIDLTYNSEVIDASETVYIEAGTASVDLSTLFQDNLPSLIVKVQDSVVENIQHDFVSYEKEIKPVSFTYDETLVLSEGSNKYMVSAEDSSGTVTAKTYDFYLLAEGEDAPTDNGGTTDPGNTGGDTGETPGGSTGGSTPTPPPVVNVTVPALAFNVTLNETNVELEVGTDAETTTFDLDATVTGDSTNSVVWSSSDETVATVDQNGVVTAVAVGTATITAARENGTQSATASVEVFLVGDEVAPLGAVTFTKPYMNGFNDGTFRPEATITRAQLAVVYSNVLGLNTEVKTAAKFSDVSEDHWSFGYVQAAARAGLFSGYEDGTFKPDAPLSRAELAATFSKFWAFQNIDVKADKVEGVKDVENHWASAHIFKLYNASVLDASVETFEPDADASRGQVVTMVNSLLGREPLEVTESKFSDVQDPDLMGAIEAATTPVQE